VRVVCEGGGWLYTAEGSPRLGSSGPRFTPHHRSSHHHHPPSSSPPSPASSSSPPSPPHLGIELSLLDPRARLLNHEPAALPRRRHPNFKDRLKYGVINTAAVSRRPAVRSRQGRGAPRWAPQEAGRPAHAAEEQQGWSSDTPHAWLPIWDGGY
jgi:hypothetical protein